MKAAPVLLQQPGATTPQHRRKEEEAMSNIDSITLRRLVDELTDEYIQSLQAENAALRAALIKAEQRAEQ